MGIIDDFGIRKDMNKEQVCKQLFSIKKKLVTKQNSANLEKRLKAESELEFLSNLQDFIENYDINDNNIQLLVQSYEFLDDNNILSGYNKEKIVAAFSGNMDASYNIVKYLEQNGVMELKDLWIIWTARCGMTSLYSLCGYILTDTDPDQALEWFEKAEQVGKIEDYNYYNWGLIYYKKGSYWQAKSLLEKSLNLGVAPAAIILGDMYEHGYGVGQDFETALKMYNLALQNGLVEVQVKIDRVNKTLRGRKTSSPTDKWAEHAAKNDEGSKRENGEDPSSDNDQNTDGTNRKGKSPVLIFKSDKVSKITELENKGREVLSDKIDIDELKGKVEKYTSKMNIDFDSVLNMDLDKVKDKFSTYFNEEELKKKIHGIDDRLDKIKEESDNPDYNNSYRNRKNLIKSIFDALKILIILAGCVLPLFNSINQ